MRLKLRRLRRRCLVCGDPAEKLVFVSKEAGTTEDYSMCRPCRKSYRHGLNYGMSPVQIKESIRQSKRHLKDQAPTVRWDPYKNR